MGLAREEFVSADHLAIPKGQRSHQRRMNVGGGGHPPVEFKITCRASVVNCNRAIAKIIRSARGSIDAHMTHGAHHHNFLNIVLVEQFLKSGPTEGIRIVLSYDWLIALGQNGFIDFSAIAARQEERTVRRFVADIDYEVTP